MGRVQRCCCSSWQLPNPSDTSLPSDAGASDGPGGDGTVSDTGTGSL